LGVNTDDFEQRTMMMDGLARGRTNNTSEKLPNREPNRTRPYTYSDDDPWNDRHNYHIMKNTAEDDEETSKHKAWFNKVHNKVHGTFHSETQHQPGSSSPFANVTNDGNGTQSTGHDEVHNDVHNEAPNKKPQLWIKTSMDKENPPRNQAGRPIVTTSANPLPGAIPPNMQGQTSDIDRAEELEQGKRDPDLVRKPPSSDETLKEEDPPKLSGPPPLVHHGDGGSTLPSPPQKSRVTDGPVPVVDPYNFTDPLADSFFYDQWNAVAEHNTAVYRRIFRPMPDNDVKSWSDYKESFAFGERLAQAEGAEKGKMRMQKEQQGASGPAGAIVGKHSKFLQGSKGEKSSRDDIEEFASAGEDIQRDEKERIKEELKGTKEEIVQEKDQLERGAEKVEHGGECGAKHLEHELKDGFHGVEHNLSGSPGTQRRRRAQSNATRAGQFSVLPRDTMEELLSEVQGHLVVWPQDWLAKEDANGNFLYNIDKLLF
jgi:hypothetical protein